MTNLREKLENIIRALWKPGEDDIDDAISEIIQAFKEVVPGEKEITPNGCGCNKHICQCEGHNQLRQEILEKL